MIRFLLVFLILGVHLNLFSQEITSDTLPKLTHQQDSIIAFRGLNKPKVVKKIKFFSKGHNPNTAAWYSAAIPGLGQAYNKKYWKIPIVWAGIVGFGYLIKRNNDQYQFYRKNLLYELNGNKSELKNETPLDATTLKRGRDLFRRNRDLTIILGVIFYMLNIVDAHVDAHLIGFNVNENLSVQLKPSIEATALNNRATGLKFLVKF